MSASKQGDQQDASNGSQDDQSRPLPRPTDADTGGRPSRPPAPFDGPSANDDRELAPEHAAHLSASGLRRETIEALKFATVNSDRARRVLGWPEDKAGDPAGLLIPYPNVTGYAKVRPDNPRVIEPAQRKVRSFTDHNYAAQAPETEAPKVIKYEAPLGSGTHCYVPLPICPALTDPSERLYITEGEKKAALMCQEGQPCISIPGVSSGHDVEHRRYAQDWGGKEFVLHEDLVPYALPGREVCIVFDSPDMEENVNVTRGAVRLAKMITSAEATALLGYVPAVEGLGKTGVDDYFIDQQRRRGALRSKLTTSPLATEFADARPVGPNALLKWLEDERRERGWVKDDLLPELRRAAIWARVWHEGEQKSFNDWCRAAAAQFYVGVADLKAMVEHLPVSSGKAKKPRVGYDTFGDAEMVEHCLPILDAAFALLRNADGTERIYSVNGRREVTLVLNDTHLVQALHDGLKEMFGCIPPERLLDRAIALWRRETKPLSEDPAPFSFQGEALTFKRFDWVPAPAPFPAWEEFLSRLSDRDAFMAFVWSCFEPQNVSRQYLWLRGNGQDGKSTVLATLLDVFGTAATGITGSQLKDNRFLYSAIYGKRVVIYADCKNPKFGMTEFVRNATSGDPVMIEFKGETPFSWRMRLKLLVGSNPKPEITGQTADASRMIYVEVGESKSKDDPTWAGRLNPELPGFLHACRAVYDRLCPHHGDIALSTASRNLQADAVAAFEERFHELFDGSFQTKAGAKAVANTVSKRLRELKLSNNEIADFKAWMERVHNVRFRRTNSERWYENLLIIDPAKEVFGR